MIHTVEARGCLMEKTWAYKNRGGRKRRKAQEGVSFGERSLGCLEHLRWELWGGAHLGKMERKSSLFEYVDLQHALYPFIGMFQDLRSLFFLFLFFWDKNVNSFSFGSMGYFLSVLNTDIVWLSTVKLWLDDYGVASWYQRYFDVQIPTWTLVGSLDKLFYLSVWQLSHLWNGISVGLHKIVHGYIQHLTVPGIVGDQTLTVPFPTPFSFFLKLSNQNFPCGEQLLPMYKSTAMVPALWLVAQLSKCLLNSRVFQ